MNKKILVTGAAGFIGFHLAKSLLETAENIVFGIDNINDYYDPNLKFARLELLGIEKSTIGWNKVVNSCIHPNFYFSRFNLEDANELFSLCLEQEFDCIINLAAQAGVRYSIENPSAYIQSNLVGFGNILEASRKINVKHLLFASSSSVYGMNKKIPFATSDNVDYPISLYAATKKANELMAHTYSHLYRIPSTGLRFFTVYGPYGRPDMAYFSFTKKILNGETIEVYNNGQMKRDFTYIDDIVEGVIRILNQPPIKSNLDPTLLVSETSAPYRIYNIGNNQPVDLRRFITALETSCDKKANENYLEMQPGDVPITFADVEDLFNDIGFKPSTEIEDGISKFVNWFKHFYNV